MPTKWPKGFSRWHSGKESICSAGDPRDSGLIPGLGGSLGEENGNPPQYSCLRNPMDRRAWQDYSPWGHKESDTTEPLNTHTPLAQEVFLKLAISFQLQSATHKANIKIYCILQNVSHKASWIKCKDLTIRMKVGEPSVQEKSLSIALPLIVKHNHMLYRDHNLQYSCLARGTICNYKFLSNYMLNIILPVSTVTIPLRKELYLFCTTRYLASISGTGIQ